MAGRYAFISKHDPIAVEIGHVIMSWGLIEGVLDEFVQELMHLDDLQFADVIVGNMDLRSKITALKGLASLRIALHRHLDPDWLEAMIKLLDHIDNELRPKRNLVAHGEWFDWGKKSNQLLTKKTKILRPQAFMRTLETRQNNRMRLPRIRAISNKILDAWFDLLHLLWYSTRPYPRQFDEDGKEYPILTLRRYLREVGHTLRAVSISPKKSRTNARRPKKATPAKATR